MVVILSGDTQSINVDGFVSNRHSWFLFSHGISASNPESKMKGTQILKMIRRKGSPRWQHSVDNVASLCLWHPGRCEHQSASIVRALSYTIWYVESKVVYVSNIRLERKKGPLRVARLPGETNPVIFSVHDEIARHYGVDEKILGESHAATIDYVVAAAGG